MPENQEKRLFLLDAMALIYRAHFAFSRNPMVNSKGQNTGAVYGFLNTLNQILKKEKPSHIGIAFDSKGPTFRHEVFEEYKANREKQPEEISWAIPKIIELLEALNIPILIKPGFEADDIVGTIAVRAEKADFQVFMVTVDKDYAQLVSENIFLYKVPYAGNKEVEILDIPKVCEKFGVARPELVADLLGLQGDSSDNIPGIPGIGPKTATKLLEKYGDLEGILAHAHELKGKQRQNVENFAEQGRLSKELATIHRDVPVPFDEADLLHGEPNAKKLGALLDELEFRRFKREFLPQVQTGLFGEPEPKKAEASKAEETAQNQENWKVNYQLCDTPEAQKALVQQLTEIGFCCLDTETTSTEARHAELVGLALAYQAGEAWYVPLPPEREKALTILEIFKPLFENKEVRKLFQNAKYDLQVLENYGIRVEGSLEDTLLMHYLLEPDERHGMDSLSKKYLNYEPVSIETLIGKKGKKQGSMRDVPVEKVYPYACEDVDVTLRLFKIFKPLLLQNELHKLYEEVEIPLLRVLSDMETEGIRLDPSTLVSFSEELGAEEQRLNEKVIAEAGVDFNVSSAKQLGEVLFEHMKLDPKAKRTSKSKQYKTDEETLVKLKDKHPIIEDILTFREVKKLKSTYVDALPVLLEKDGRIHTSYNQAVAATGRLSSSKPNLQNIPIRTERGKMLRKAFVARDENHVLLAADYSQIELRIMAAFAEDEHMIAAFRAGEDIHRATAAKIFGVTPEEVDGEMRRRAKTANFGIIYGISAHGLSQRLNIPRGDAQEIISSYFEQFPSVKSYMDNTIQEAREQGYVKTLMGRRRYLPNINSRNGMQRGFAERTAINAPIQGTAADVIKLAMVHIQDWLQSSKFQTKMILQVHDELIFDVPREELEEVQAGVVRLMEAAHPMPVPLLVEAGVGEDWLEAH